MIIYVFASLLALGAVAGLVGAIVALTASSQAGSSGGVFGSVFGMVAGAWSGLVLGVAVVYALFAGFWFWTATALRRGSTVAQILATVGASLGLLVAVGFLLGGVGDLDSEGGLVVAGVGLLLAAPPTAVILLLWVPESARRHFAPAPPPAPLSPPVAWAPPSSSWPLDASTDRLSPDRAPAPRCRRCGTETERHWAHCGHCGDRLPTVGV